MYANSKGSGESAHLRRLAGAFIAGQCVSNKSHVQAHLYLCWLIYFSAFKDSLNISPVFPFHPDKKPDQGILKSTPEGGQGTPKQTIKPVQSLFLKQVGSSSSAKGVLRGQHGRGGKSGTPVSTLTLQHKKKPVMKLVKRAKAADFFSS